MKGSAQKCHVTGHDKHRTQRRWQEPAARVVGADECRQVHNEFVLARFKLHHVTRLCVGNGLSVERTDGGQHGRATLLVVFERHLANTAVDAHLAHTIDFATEL